MNEDIRENRRKLRDLNGGQYRDAAGDRVKMSSPVRRLRVDGGAGAPALREIQRRDLLTFLGNHTRHRA